MIHEIEKLVDAFVSRRQAQRVTIRRSDHRILRNLASKYSILTSGRYSFSLIAVGWAHSPRPGLLPIQLLQNRDRLEHFYLGLTALLLRHAADSLPRKAWYHFRFPRLPGVDRIFGRR
jgi:hypothetical protein